jgi:hypothetical protein
MTVSFVTISVPQTQSSICRAYEKECGSISHPYAVMGTLAARVT